VIQKRPVIGAAAFFVVMALVVGSFALAANGGGKEDPLVTLGYLESIYPQIEATIEATVREKVDAQILDFQDLLTQAQNNIGGLSPGVSTADMSELLNNEAFISSIASAMVSQIGVSAGGSLDAVSQRVEVNANSTLHLPMGSSVMLRLGTGTVVASNSPGLINLTDGSVLDNGSNLVANNLYTVTMEAGRDIKCTAKMTVFIWGPYTIR
jgi:hypothetical protein